MAGWIGGSVLVLIFLFAVAYWNLPPQCDQEGAPKIRQRLWEFFLAVFVAAIISVVIFNAENAREEDRLVRAQRSELIAGVILKEDLEGIILQGQDLQGIVLPRRDLSGANLSEADLIGADLFDATLVDTIIADAELIGADLGSADVRGAFLRRSDLTDACLSDADLTRSPNRDRGVDLRDADLIGADLTFADLTGADLTGADLSGADLRGTIFVDLLNPLDNTINGVTILTDVMWDERTDWGGFIPPRSAPIVPLGRCVPGVGN